jgi:hypothetical protein
VDRQPDAPTRRLGQAEAQAREGQEAARHDEAAEGDPPIRVAPRASVRRTVAGPGIGRAGLAGGIGPDQLSGSPSPAWTRPSAPRPTRLKAWVTIG